MSQSKFISVFKVILKFLTGFVIGCFIALVYLGIKTDCPNTAIYVYCKSAG